MMDSPGSVSQTSRCHESCYTRLATGRPYSVLLQLESDPKHDVCEPCDGTLPRKSSRHQGVADSRVSKGLLAAIARRSTQYVGV